MTVIMVVGVGVGIGVGLGVAVVVTVVVGVRRGLRLVLTVAKGVTIVTAQGNTRAVADPPMRTRVAAAQMAQGRHGR